MSGVGIILMDVLLRVTNIHKNKPLAHRCDEFHSRTHCCKLNITGVASLVLHTLQCSCDRWLENLHPMPDARLFCFVGTNAYVPATLFALLLTLSGSCQALLKDLMKSFSTHTFCKKPRSRIFHDVALIICHK